MIAGQLVLVEVAPPPVLVAPVEGEVVTAGRLPVEVVVVEVVQLDLFSWAARTALSCGSAATERACSLRGAARRGVERVACRFFTEAGYWRAWSLGVRW